MKLLHSNYLKSSGNGSTWNVEISSPVRPINSYYDETVAVAEMVWAEKQGNLFLCYSGGLDSEYVLAVFKSLGMPITPIIMRTQYNDHETQYAFKYCDENSITPVVIDLDYDKYDFVSKTKEQLAYFESVYFDFMDEDIKNDFVIFRGEHFQFSEMATDSKIRIKTYNI